MGLFPVIEQDARLHEKRLVLPRLGQLQFLLHGVSYCIGISVYRYISVSVGKILFSSIPYILQQSWAMDAGFFPFNVAVLI